MMYIVGVLSAIWYRKPTPESGTSMRSSYQCPSSTEISREDEVTELAGTHP